jgi:hypothetical protein
MHPGEIFLVVNKENKMAMPISKHRSGDGDTTPRYEVMVVHGQLQTKVVIHTGSGMNVLRLTPLPGKPGHYEGNLYLMRDDSPEELKPHAKVRAHFEQNYDTLQLSYRMAQAGKSPDMVKLVGQAKDGKSMYSMLLLP